MHVHRMPLLTLTALLAVLATAGGCGRDAAKQAAEEDAAKTLELRYQVARAEILPSAAERRWEEIDWHPTYAGGLRASSDQQKPLLLWVMNGHPLGCT